MTSRSVVVFARAPLPGQVKTRLAAELGEAEALRIYRRLGLHAVTEARQVPNCRVVVAYTPSDRAAEIRDWLGGDLDVMPQEGADLGERMLAAVRAQLRTPGDRVAVIGTDCPGLSFSLIEQALDALENSDAVFGPAADGGYYLIAMRRPLDALFTGVPWSSPDTLRLTLERAREAAVSVTLLPVLDDIDTADDWRRWCAAQAGGISPSDGL